MKFSILLDILIELLSKRRVTASYLAEKHSLSQRTVYRYIAILAETVPAQIKRGRGGGICLSDSYKLPLGFLTAEEYDAAIEALSEAYTRSPEARFLDAKRKLSAQEKADLREFSLSGEAGDILVDENALSLPLSAAEKLRLMGAPIRSLNVLEIEYVENGEKTFRKIEPHTLVLEGDAWQVYAFCHVKREFCLFRLGNIASIVQTEETFRKRPFEREDIPLARKEKTVPVRLEIEKNALKAAQDWLGVENIRARKGKFVADVLLPENEGLARKILSLGTGVKVLSPASLKARVVALAEEVTKLYS